MAITRAIHHPFQSLLGIAIIIHAMLFANDWYHGFTAFLKGDRSYGRMEALQQLISTEPSNYLSTAVQGQVIPSEYLFQLPVYLIGGVPGIILFQVVLAILSVMCVARIASRLFTWPHAGITIGLIYLLLPQNLVFAHQFVTEAIATPFCVFFLYFIVKAFTGEGSRHAIWAGLCFGLAIFIRPSLLMALPAFIVLAVLYAPHYRAILLATVVAILPLAMWVGVFTSVTGQVGYTNGVANLGWNLRSKVFLVDQANGFEKHDEVKQFKDYADLYTDSNGISVKRFAQIAREQPTAYIKAALVDAAIVFGKGNSTKLTVDYLGIARDSGIKGWRDVFEADGVSGLARWAFAQLDMLTVFGFEVIASLVTIACSAAVFLFILAVFLRGRVRSKLSAAQASMVVVMAALLFSVLMSAEIVDRAQARLRHPVEAGMLLLLGIALRVRRTESVVP